VFLLLAGGAAAQQSGDPLRPPGYHSGPAAKGAERPRKPSYHLSSILITDAGRRAIINGRSVAEGEAIDGARVEAISANQVTLQRDGRRLTLEFLPYRIKKPSEANGQ
jgi:hypothetical protein